MTSEAKLEQKTSRLNKKMATMALAGALAMGAFTAAPAYAGGMGNGCNANGCKSETKPAPAQNSCKGKSGCPSKSSCKSKSGCPSKSGCKDKSSCKSSNSCKGKKGHNDNDRYND